MLIDWLEQLPEQTRPEWTAEVARLRKEYPLELDGLDDPRRSYGIIRRCGQLVGEDVIVTTDVGQHQMRVAQAYPFARPRRWLTSGGLGTMGFGLPAAIGAALAEPEATVLCFSGDGSFLLNCQELATLREEELKVKIILLDNCGYGLVNQQQDLFYGKRRFAVEFKHPVDFVQLAASFGIDGFSMTEDDAEERLEAALAAPGPSLIHVPAQLAEKVFPMVAPGRSNADMITLETD